MQNGGKSRKSGGVSNRLINRIIKNQALVKSATNTEKLMSAANHSHHQAVTAWTGWLDYAHQCGEALLKIKATVEHGCWLDLISEHFDGTYSNAKVYMRIAKYWHDPRIKAARDQGVELNSIKSVLDVLAKRPVPHILSLGMLNKDEQKVVEYQRDIRKKFTKHINREFKDMNQGELKALNDSFDELWRRWLNTFYEAYQQRKTKNRHPKTVSTT